MIPSTGTSLVRWNPALWKSVTTWRTNLRRKNVAVNSANLKINIDHDIKYIWLILPPSETPGKNPLHPSETIQYLQSTASRDGFIYIQSGARFTSKHFLNDSFHGRNSSAATNNFNGIDFILFQTCDAQRESNKIRLPIWDILKCLHVPDSANTLCSGGSILASRWALSSSNCSLMTKKCRGDYCTCT